MQFGLRSIVPVMGKWSVRAGQSSGLVLHSMKAWRRAELQKTLSGLDRLPVLKVSMVGIPAGSSISIPKVSMRSIRGEAASRLAGVKRQMLFGSSHRGWCLLKSPSHTTLLFSFWCGGCACIQKSCKLRKVSALSQGL